MIVIYNILLYCWFIAAFPFYAVKFFTSERYRTGLIQRLGFVKTTANGPRILLHTVSVGEFLGAQPFIDALRDRYPRHSVVVSTTTVTGNKVARAKNGNAGGVVYFPLDFWFSVKRFFKRVSPDLIILIETELWPNFLTISKKMGVPVIVINGRISGHSYRNYSLLKGFFRNMCKGIRMWGVQFERDRDRLADLGIERDSIHVTGSMKFDSAVKQAPAEGVTDDTMTIVGGSTHNGEEKILLDIYRDIKDNFTPPRCDIGAGLVLILAPRHPERSKSIKRLIEGYGFTPKNFQGNFKGFTDKEVVLVDKIGELVSIYKTATVVFIGKSLTKGGGQNLLEPAGLGKPVICGPLMGNFLDITQWMVENGGIIQVRDAVELKQAIIHLLNNPKERHRLGCRARELVQKAGGAVRRNMELVDKVLIKSVL